MDIEDRKFLALLATAELSGEQLSRLSGEQLSRLSCEQLSRLTGEQLSCLSCEQLSWISGEQLLCLSREQLSWISGEQLLCLSREQLSCLSREQLSWLSREQLLRLSGEELLRLSDERLSRLTGEQLSWQESPKDKELTVPDLYSSILLDIKKERRHLDQSTVGKETPPLNLCDSPMCIAGHTVNLLGEKGYALARKYGVVIAARMIHRASCDFPLPRYDNYPNEWALAYIQEMAEREAHEQN